MSGFNMTIIYNGLVENMTNADYHSSVGVSKSSLDKIAISPLAYWDAYLNPDREPQEYKHCFAVGDGTHKLILEPGEFEKHYAVGFDKSAHPDALDTVADMKKELSSRNMMVSGSKPELADRLVNESDFPRSKINLFLEQDHNLNIAGRIPMPAKDYKNMASMLKSVSSHHTASGLIHGCSVEQSFFVTDASGIIRKIRTDLITSDGHVVGDLKTTDDVSPAGFGRTIWNYRYLVQGAWYLDVLKMLYGSDAPKIFAFIPVQKTRPHDCAVHYLNDDQIAIGRAIYKKDLDVYIRCRDSGKWPGADGGEIIEAQLPSWANNFSMEFNL